MGVWERIWSQFQQGKDFNADINRTAATTPGVGQQRQNAIELQKQRNINAQAERATQHTGVPLTNAPVGRPDGYATNLSKYWLDPVKNDAEAGVSVVPATSALSNEGQSGSISPTAAVAAKTEDLNWGHDPLASSNEGQSGSISPTAAGASVGEPKPYAEGYYNTMREMKGAEPKGPMGDMAVTKDWGDEWGNPKHGATDEFIDYSIPKDNYVMQSSENPEQEPGMFDNFTWKDGAAVANYFQNLERTGLMRDQLDLQKDAYKGDVGRWNKLYADAQARKASGKAESQGRRVT